MNTTTLHDDGDRPDDDILAGEHALGLLDATARAAAEARVASDPAFARAVAAWDRHFAPWFDAIPAVAAPAGVWPRVRDALGFDRAAQATPARSASKRDDGNEGWWQSLAFWRGVGFAGFATAAVSAIALFTVLQRPAPAPVVAPPEPVAAVAPRAPDMVASVVGEDGKASFVAGIDSTSATMMMMPMAPSIPADRVPELWLIPTDGVPRSLGLLDPTRAHSVTVPESMRAMMDGASIAVSLEPAGGSPTGGPTGPVIGAGAITRI